MQLTSTQGAATYSFQVRVADPHVLDMLYTRRLKAPLRLISKKHLVLLMVTVLLSPESSTPIL